MNIQIFGTNKSFDTKKAQRWFKERRIKFQMVDLKEKGLSRGEFDRVCQAGAAGRPWWTEPPKTRIPLPCCAGWTKASRLTNCLKTSSFCANPLYAMAAPPQWGTGRRFGRSGNKVLSLPVNCFFL